MAVVSFQNWPVADDKARAWNGAAATRRLRKWVSDKDQADWGTSEWNKYRRLHLWYDADAPDKDGGYKFAVVDVVDGAPKYVFRAAAASLAVCRGGRGGGPGADWWDDRMKMISHIGRIYKKFGEDMPGESSLGEGVAMCGDDLDELLLDMKENAEEATPPIEVAPVKQPSAPLDDPEPVVEVQQKMFTYQSERDLRISKRDGVERKSLIVQGIRFKAATDPDAAKYQGGTIEGHASVFNNVDAYGDVVKPGAFRKTIKEQRNGVLLLDNHKMMAGAIAAVGRTYHMAEDTMGLLFRAFVSTAPDAQSVRQKVLEGVLDSLSFGYTVLKSKPKKVGESQVMELLELKLWEISVVLFPANPLALITGAKSAMEDFELCEDATRGFDAELAFKRFYDHVGGGLTMTDWDDEQVRVFASGFAVYDQNGATRREMFQHQLVDVVDGEPRVVLSALMRAKSALPQNDAVEKYIKQFPEEERREPVVEVVPSSELQHFRRTLSLGGRQPEALVKFRQSMKAVLESRKAGA